MPMDRLDHTWPGGRVALVVGAILMFAGGCRSTRSEVPPGKPYQTTGGMPPTVGFSSDPRPSAAAGLGGLYGNKGPGALVPDGAGSPSPSNDLVLGTPTPADGKIGAPSDHRYGPPGTAGTPGGGPSGSPTLGDSLLKTIPSGSKIAADSPDPDAAPASTTRSAGGNYP
jgi:hypothetical protein